MIRLIIRLAVAAVIANATWHIGSAYMSHYRFKDAVKEAALFQTAKSDDQLKQRVLELASQFDVPLVEDNVTVRRDNGHTFVDGSYTRMIEFVPTLRQRFAFDVHIDTLNFEGVQGAPPR